MRTPPITVLMPVYNAETYLRPAIESILNQTFLDFEFLIINDGSTDASEKIITSYSDKRIRYIKNESNIKLIATLNKGIDLCYGRYIARMDADDISMPERLQVQFDFMEEHPKVAICGSWFQMTGSDNDFTVKYVASHENIMMKMLYQCHFCHPSVILRKSMIESFPIRYDARFLHAEDYEFFTRVGEKFELANIQQVLLKYRTHPNSVSAQNPEMQDKNSVIVKKRLFENIGLNVSEQELETYRTIAQHEYRINEEYLDQSMLLLEKMALANNQSHYFDKKFFTSYLSLLWLNVAYNSSRLGITSFHKYRSSFLFSLRSTGIWGLLKFWIKAFFRL